MMTRLETKGRARALQLLYAWELQGASMPDDIVPGVAKLTRPEPRVLDHAEHLAAEVARQVGAIDREVSKAAENWRFDRIAMVERNIIRIGVCELMANDVPPKVAIDEAVQLAHWFGGARAPGFVNGVLDRVARTLGRL